MPSARPGPRLPIKPTCSGSLRPRLPGDSGLVWLPVHEATVQREGRSEGECLPEGHPACAQTPLGTAPHSHSSAPRRSPPHTSPRLPHPSHGSVPARCRPQTHRASSHLPPPPGVSALDASLPPCHSPGCWSQGPGTPTAAHPLLPYQAATPAPQGEDPHRLFRGSPPSVCRLHPQPGPPFKAAAVPLPPSAPVHLLQAQPLWSPGLPSPSPRRALAPPAQG